MNQAVRADIRANTHALYRFYDDHGELLYVGITNEPGRRFEEHASEKPWWRKVATIKIDRSFRNRADLAAAEITAIETERPKYNRAHSTGVIETVRPNTHHGATSPWPDASRFGTEPPRTDLKTKIWIRQNLACPHCGGRVSQAMNDQREPIGDLTCGHCESTWTPQEWRHAMFSL